MRNETVEEFIARGGKVSKSTKVLGEKKTLSVNYKGSSCRLGKNGSGKTSRCEIRGINPCHPVSMVHLGFTNNKKGIK